jgi:hypothetical protein
VTWHYNPAGAWSIDSSGRKRLILPPTSHSWGCSLVPGGPGLSCFCNQILSHLVVAAVGANNLDGGNCCGRTTGPVAAWVQWKVRPPSTASAAPVMNEDSEPVRYRMACAISNGSATRLSAYGVTSR